jgi:hypothetical protein
MYQENNSNEIYISSQSSSSWSSSDKSKNNGATSQENTHNDTTFNEATNDSFKPTEESKTQESLNVTPVQQDSESDPDIREDVFQRHLKFPLAQ